MRTFPTRLKNLSVSFCVSPSQPFSAFSPFCSFSSFSLASSCIEKRSNRTSRTTSSSRSVSSLWLSVRHIQTPSPPSCLAFAPSSGLGQSRSSFSASASSPTPPEGHHRPTSSFSVTANRPAVFSSSSEFLFDKQKKSRFVHKSMPPPPSIASSRSVGQWNTVVVSHISSLPLLTLDICFLLPHTAYDKTPLVKSIARESHTSALTTVERMRLLLAPSRASPPAAQPPSSTGQKREMERKCFTKNGMQRKEEQLKACPSITVYGIEPSSGDSRGTRSSTTASAAVGTSPVCVTPTTAGASASSTGDQDITCTDKGERDSKGDGVSTSDGTAVAGDEKKKASQREYTEGDIGKNLLEVSIKEKWRELDPSKWSNEEFWKYAKLLRINDTDIRVYYNRPLVVSVAPLPIPHVGSPLICVDFKVLFASISDVSYQWLCEDGKGGRMLLSTDPVFIPTPDLVFKVLILRLSAEGQDGMWTEMKTERVKPAEEKIARWEHTPTVLAAPALRVVTYNVLYDGFCMNSFGRKYIYPFCTKEVLDEKQRAIRIRRELISYHADLICLQECGKRIFSQFYLPSFRLLGYEGLHMKKNGSVQEGCAVFYRTARFAVLKESTIPLNMETLQTFFPILASSIKKYKEFDEALTKMTAIGVGLRMKDKETGKTFVLGNTHLFYHADGCHIRMVQAYMQMHHLYRLASGGHMSRASMTTTSAPTTMVDSAGVDERSSTLATSGPSTSGTGRGKDGDGLRFESPHDEGNVPKESHRAGEGTPTPPLSSSHLCHDPSFSGPRDGLPGSPSTVDPIIFCGDGNCTHATGAYRLLSTGHVEEDHVSWEKGTLFWYGGDKKLGTPYEEEEEEVVNGKPAGAGGLDGPSAHVGGAAPPIRSPLHFPPPPPPPFGEEFYRTELSVPFRMKDAYDSCPTPLPWTNYTRDFKEVIDYIMVSHGRAEVLQAVPIPPEEELCSNCALPNEKYASDHLALIADIKFL